MIPDVAAAIWRRVGGSWTLEEELVPIGPVADPEAYFGYSCAIENGRVVVGAPGWWTANNSKGAVIVYEYREGLDSWNALIISNQPTSAWTTPRMLPASAGKLPWMGIPSWSPPPRPPSTALRGWRCLPLQTEGGWLPVSRADLQGSPGC